MENISLLKSSDQVKFVITSREDYEWARFQVDQFGLDQRVDDVLFSPSFGRCNPRCSRLGFLKTDYRCECSCSYTRFFGGQARCLTRRPSCSGGLDSATVLAHAVSEGFHCHCLSFDYGQSHQAELAHARVLADSLGAASHRTAHLDLAVFGGSALTDENIQVPDADSGSEQIPVTYVPARNTVFLAYALAWGEVLLAYDLFISVNAVDYSGYPDCRPALLKRLNGWRIRPLRLVLNPKRSKSMPLFCTSQKVRSFRRELG